MVYQVPSKQTLIERNANIIICEKKRISSLLKSIRKKQNDRASYTIEDAYREIGRRNEMALIGFHHLLEKGFSAYEAVSAANKIRTLGHSEFQGMRLELLTAEKEAEKYRNLLLEIDRIEKLMLTEAQMEIRTARRNIRQLTNGLPFN